MRWKPVPQDKLPRHSPNRTPPQRARGKTTTQSHALRGPAVPGCGACAARANQPTRKRNRSKGQANYTTAHAALPRTRHAHAQRLATILHHSMTGRASAAHTAQRPNGQGQGMRATKHNARGGRARSRDAPTQPTQPTQLTWHDRNRREGTHHGSRRQRACFGTKRGQRGGIGL